MTQPPGEDFEDVSSIVKDKKVSYEAAKSEDFLRTIRKPKLFS